MRMVLIASAALLAGAALGQSSSPDLRMGRSAQAIANMGHDAWINLFGEKFGNSTGALSGGEEAYADALTELNNAMLAKLSAKEAENWRLLRTSMLTIAQQANSAGRAYTGGGTKWNIQANASVGNAEEALYDCLRDQIPASETRTQDLVWDSYRRALDEIHDSRDELDAGKQFSGMDYRETVGVMSQMGNEMMRTLRLISDKPVKARGRIMYYLTQQTGLIG